MSDEIHVGVLLLGQGVQMLDLAGIDLFGNMTPLYCQMCGPWMPSEIAAQAVPFKIHYIAASGAGSTFQLTADAKTAINYGYQDCPPLDILLVPGPEPGYRLDDESRNFILKQLGNLSVLMSVCTGIQAILQTGLTGGKNVSAPLRTFHKFFSI